MNTSAPLPANLPSTKSRDIIKREDGFFAYYFSAQIAYLIVRCLAPLPIRPNHYTFASLVLGFAAAWFFLHGDHRSLIIGVILLNLSFIFDCCDGQVARLKNAGSAMGAWFDYHADKLKDGAVLLGLAIGAATQDESVQSWVFIVAFLTIFFQFLRNIAALNRDNALLERTGKKDQPHYVMAQQGNQFLRTLKHSSLFKLSDRVLLLSIMGIFNVVPQGLVVYCALEIIYSLSSAYLNYRLFNRFDHEQSH